MKSKRSVFTGILASLGGFLFSHAPLLVDAAQPLETETARFVEAGRLRMESTVEFQTSSQGQEYMFPLAFTYGLRNDVELVVEPVVYSLIVPMEGGGHTGLAIRRSL